MVDETHNPFVGDESKFEQREAELQKKLVLPCSGLPAYPVDECLYAKACNFD